MHVHIHAHTLTHLHVPEHIEWHETSPVSFLVVLLHLPVALHLHAFDQAVPPSLLTPGKMRSKLEGRVGMFMNVKSKLEGRVGMYMNVKSKLERR